MPRPSAPRRVASAGAVTALVLIALVAAVIPAGAQRATEGDFAGAATVRDLGHADIERGTSAVISRYQRLADTPGAVPGEVLVTYADAVDLERRSRSSWQSATTAGADAARRLSDRVALVTAEEHDVNELVEVLSTDPAVLAIEPNVRREYLAAPDDTSFDLQWSHGQTNAEAAWDTFTGDGATAPLIAILDSGIDATHPDLDGIVVDSLRSANGSVIPGAANNDPCNIGHGTAVAGSAAARGNNGQGIAGALWNARIIDIALTSPENGCPGGPSDADTITAMDYVTGLAEKPWAMNLSLGASLTSCTTAYQAAADQARDAGILVVAAAGNDGSSRTSVPASCEGVVSVSASNSDGERAQYSQTNPQVDIAAPGGDFQNPPYTSLEAQFRDAVAVPCLPGATLASPVCQNPERLDATSGTSFASPYVAAAVGLIRQLAADRGQPISPDQTEAIIEATAADAGDLGRDCEFGWGIIDMQAAVAAVVDGDRPPLQPDAPIGTGTCDGGDPGEPSCNGIVASDGGPVRRVADSGGATEAVCQAVAMSQLLPGQAARFAVLARSDDFADALAGSAVGLGIGPLLFTSSSGTLDPRTEEELQRVLSREEGTPTVFIMGGTAAIPESVDSRLKALGIEAIRVAGNGREATAAAAAQTVRALTQNASFATRDYAFVAYGRNFADAVAAGQMAAYYGIPILVTNTDSLHPVTAAELEALSPERVFALGGEAVIGDRVIEDIRELGLSVDRLAGDTRVGTAMAIRDLYLDEVAADGAGQPNTMANIAVNLRNNYNDVLSASLLGGTGGVFLPLEEDASGSVITEEVRSGFCGVGGNLFVVGGPDRVSEVTAQEAFEITQGNGC